jgi:hypothetical protein
MQRLGTEITLNQFWEFASMAKLEAKFAIAKEINELEHFSLAQLRAMVLQYRYFTEAFATDVAFLVARCRPSRLRSLLAGLLHEELGDGDPEASHLRLYDRFLESVGAIPVGASAGTLAEHQNPRVRDLLADLHDRTLQRSLHYAIGLRGMGGECVCGVYFSVMHGYLLKHPYIVEHHDRIDWRFWDIHAGHADLEHNQMVRAALVEFLRDDPEAVGEVAAGFEHGTAAWDEFWSVVYPGTRRA